MAELTGGNPPQNAVGDGAQKHWWWNLNTRQVEFGLQSAALNRVGPFATQAEAEAAPTLLAERSRAWAEEESLDD